MSIANWCRLWTFSSAMRDFSATLGVAIEGVADDFNHLPVSSYESMLHRVSEFYPNLKLVATTLRTAHTSTKNDWGAIAL